IADAVRSRLASSGIPASAVTVSSVVAKAGGEALATVVLTVPVSGADAPKARTALRSAGGLSFPFVEKIRIRLESSAAAPINVDIAREPAPVRGPIGRRPGSGAKPRLTLANFYDNEGFLGDSDNNLIPDRVDILLSPSGPGTESTVDLAARIGLESTGIAIPAAEPPEAIGPPEQAPTLVLIGIAHPLQQRLIDE